ncbi:RED-like protein [Hirsutella rhossiliensis]|uniref:RED-like protein n=1 Tax=Hirsutella rhossiliensis TaxID=111463 RepID=A0A9P8N798_9HYPO|nr:RED-like protein [Hirsutella rhossiliensis]KAH0967271.1 RED-like protein [Hirsutella rhossiliensis]
MNNDQFRKLVLANSKHSPGAKNGPSPEADSRSGSGSLGSRQRASIPMTPRSVAGAQAEFARQLAERNQAAQPQKNFKAFVPKGAKLAAGYTDRTKERLDEAADDRKERLAALEQSLNKGEVDKETYDKLRFEIAGGSLETTHLVKGLDFKLLERVRRGEDVYSNKKGDASDDKSDEDDVDDAFDELERREVSAIEKEQTERKAGQLAAFPVVAGKKKSRNQILAELRASREAAKAQQVSSLGSKFKKIGTKQKPGTRIERDKKGREVLIIVDEDGYEKRKVRKLKAWEEEDEDGAGNDLPMPDPRAKPLGMEVPEEYRQRAGPEEDVDDDIFGGVGDDYDPLAGMDVSDSDSDLDSSRPEDIDGQRSNEAANGPNKAGMSDAEMMPPPPKITKPAAPHNYFKDSKTGLLSAEAAEKPSMKDPAIMAAIKRAAALGHIGDGDGDKDEAGKGGESMEERRRRLLRMSERDDADLDMGFGTSRLEDEEDGDEQRVKLSAWDGGGGDGGEGGSRGGQGKRKRGPKKRKGDANSAADVLRVMEQRKKS